MITTRLTRRTVMAGMAVIAGQIASPAILRGNARAQGSKKLSIICGRQPQGVTATAISRHVIETGLFRQEAAAFGYDLTVDFRDFPNAGPIMELLKAGPEQMAIAVIGNTPSVIAMANNLPIQVLTSAEGKLPFYVLVRPDSDIKTIQDLRGKTIGTILGTDPHSALLQILLAEFNSTPDELGIRLQNFPEFPSLARLPRGIDAAAVVPPVPALPAIDDGAAVVLFDTLGNTGPAYEGGEGQRLESVANSLFRPEGYFCHRGFWVAHGEIMEREPDLVRAWIITQQKALDALKALGPEAVAKNNEVDWKRPAEVGAGFLRNDLVWDRGWVWMTEGEILSAVTASPQMAKAGAIQRPVTWEVAQDHLAPVAAMQEEIWKSLGSNPSQSEFEKADAELAELRGLPVWQSANWARYKDRG